MNDYTLGLDDLTLTMAQEDFIGWAYPDPMSPLAKKLQSLGLWHNVLYKDPTIDATLRAQYSGAPWTRGFGHAKPGVQYGDRVTKQQAEVDLLADMASAVAAVKKALTVQVSREQFIALCDLAFNIGNTAFATSTLCRDINAHQWQAAIDQFAVWNKAGGQVSDALVDRRDAEKAMFILGTDYSA
jgi:lysozyme